MSSSRGLWFLGRREDQASAPGRSPRPDMWIAWRSAVLEKLHSIISRNRRREIETIDINIANDHDEEDWTAYLNRKSAEAIEKNHHETQDDNIV